MSQRRHIRNPLADEIAVDRRGSAEGSHSVTIDHSGQLLRLKVIEIIDHDRTADEPLSVDLSPGCFRPACLRNRKMKTALLRLLPVLRRDDMRERIAVIVNDTFGLARSTGCEIQHHRIRRQGLDTLEFFGGSLHGFGQIFESGDIFLNTPQSGCHAGRFQCCGDLLGDLFLRRAHNGFYAGRFYAVHKIPDRQHMRCRDHHGTQLVQGNGREPVFIVPFQDQQNAVAAADPGAAEYICHLIAVSFYIRK